jgi:hypothetical protein
MLVERRRQILANPWLRKMFFPPATTADTSRDLDESTARHVAGYGFEDFAGIPSLPDDLVERLQMDLDFDARRAGGGR